MKIAYDKDKQNATYKRYHDKAYKRVVLTLHKKHHAPEIEYLEGEKEKGSSPTQTVLTLIREKLKG